MLKIKKQYVVDEKKRPFAVQVDIETFEKMETLIEDYALGQLIRENDTRVRYWPLKKARNIIINWLKSSYQTLASSGAIMIFTR